MTDARTKWTGDNVRGKRILDIGFASTTNGGEFLHALVREKNPESFIVGVDRSARAFELPSGDAVQADAAKLPFKGKSFDAVSMLEVIEHVWNPKWLLEEANRVLVKNGVLFLTTPNPHDFVRILKLALRGETDLGGEKEHKLYHEKAGLFSLLEKSGFEIEKYETNKLRIPIIRVEFNHNPFPFTSLGYNQCIVARKRGPVE